MPMPDTDLLVARDAVTLRARVEAKIRAAIASGRFKAGQRLVEREMCELLGVSRPLVREALRQLEAEKLIVTVPHRGPMVAGLTIEEARQLYAVRAMLEGFAGRSSAANASPQQIQRIKLSVDRLKHAIAALGAATDAELMEARSGFYDALTAFYDAFLDSCGNDTAHQLIKALHNRVTFIRATVHPGRLPQLVKEIRKIYDRIAARDPAGAEAACILHVESAAKVAIGALAALGAPQTLHAANRVA